MVNALILILFMGIFFLQNQIRQKLPGIRLAVLGLFFSIGIIGSVNWVLSGKFFISKSGPVFLTARIIETGIANRFLNQNPEKCPDFQKVKSRFPMPAEHFLWKKDSPLATLGGISDSSGKMAEFNRDVFSSPANILLFMKAGLKSGLKQLFQLDIGDGLRPAGFPQLYFYPENMAEHLLSKQSTGIDFEKLNSWCFGLTTSLFILFLVFVLPFGLNRELKQLLIFSVSLLILNAFVNGALSTPLNRYQVRVFWLVDFWLLAASYPVLKNISSFFRNQTT
jgi:hypothetical protein